MICAVASIANADGFGLRLDVQADLLDDLATRAVVPLPPLNQAPPLCRSLVSPRGICRAVDPFATLPEDLKVTITDQILDHLVASGVARARYQTAVA